MLTLAVRRQIIALALVLPALLLAACGSAPASSGSGGVAPRQPAAAQPTIIAVGPAEAADMAAAEAPLPIADTGAPAPTAAPVVEVNPYTRTVDDALSTFALDVDTASYSAARAYLERGSLPPADLVRVEEFVNAFDYDYPQPADTFGIYVDGAASPFGAANSRLLRVGIQGMQIDSSQRQDAVLTFVVDVSGSMADPARLPLVKESLALLVDQLRPGDKVAIVAYGDDAYTVLEPTGVEQRETILDAIESLRINGSTNAEAGLKLGYELAGNAFVRGATNRVMLLSDGVANVGATGPEDILRTIRDRAAQGIYLTTVGFGMGTYNDYMMEQLANDGDGSYAYVDDIDEARRVFVENLTGTLQVIAKDTKVQVEFNSAVVSQYRLLGYENRAVADADFRNDAVDAGEIGAGHSVTALYEVVLTEQGAGDMLNVSLRWAHPESGEVRELARPFNSEELGPDFFAAAPGLRLSAAVATFAEILRGSAYAQGRELSDLRSVVEAVAAERPNDARVQELLTLIDRAIEIGA